MELDDIFSLIKQGKFNNPHEFLGLSHHEDGSSIIRLWRPGSETCNIKFGEKIIEAESAGSTGLFICKIDQQIQASEYCVSHSNGRWENDPYAFNQFLGELDVHLLRKGLHYELYDHLGATPRAHEGVMGMSYALWAPNAKAVLLKGDFNGFCGQTNPMRVIEGTGIWELFVPGLENGEKYLFEVITQEGEHFVKSDPVAHYVEVRPSYKSITFDVNQYSWGDQGWMEERKKFKKGNTPLNIYEVHPSSWKQENGAFLNYRELAHELARYCKRMHYTHVELMGICEHPLDESWGYQVTGYFAPTSRHGDPTDFQYLVDTLHQEGIGVLLDWVPGHFPIDPHSLCLFDGTYLYEHMDMRQGYHPHWNTHIFNYGRWEVSNFLIASALFWLEKMHIDGLRVDAVASMLYLDYGRKKGEWIPNSKGHNVNLEALEFIKHLNSIVMQRVPDVLMIAEESTAFPGVTRSVEEDGLGFDLKWNLGWMNDTLQFFSSPFSKRGKLLTNLAFTCQYAFEEKFVLVLSHDEVVHCKRSLLSKMPGNREQRFAGLRNLLAYTMCSPGKKLLFMGGELGQPNEWDCKAQLPWDLLEIEEHLKLQQMIQALNAFYLKSPALYEGDHARSSFEWIASGDQDQPVLGFLRKGNEQILLCMHHFGPDPVEAYRISTSTQSSACEFFNTDSAQWGGSGMVNSEIKVEAGEIQLRLPPLSTLVIELI